MKRCTFIDHTHTFYFSNKLFENRKRKYFSSYLFVVIKHWVSVSESDTLFYDGQLFTFEQNPLCPIKYDLSKLKKSNSANPFDETVRDQNMRI